MRLVALVVVAVLLGSCGEPRPESPANPPNVIVMMADDLGWGDVGANGGTVIRTPHIDALAGRGVRISDGYVSAAVCSPSRAGFYTGRHQQRHGFEYNIAGRDTRRGMSTEEATIADFMREQGYATGLIGKWHLGKRKEHHPLSRGFDEYFGMLAGGSMYIDSRVQGVESWPSRNRPTARTDSNAIYDGLEPVPVSRYLTDVFRERAVDFIERHRNERFFLMLTPNAPHTPLQATQEYLDRYRHIEKASARIYAAMVASVDDYVGAVVAKLAELGLEENTLFVFLSDNGCASYIDEACSNAPLRGAKRYYWEGGIRVPFIAKWPAWLPEGATYGEPVISLDLYATLAAAVGSPATAQDSVNLLPHWRGERSKPPHELLFWRAKPNSAVRKGRWKLWKVNKSDMDFAAVTDTGASRLPMQPWPQDSPQGQMTLLYDLSQDIGERVNLADEHPEVVSELEGHLRDWNTRMGEPSWPALRSTLDEIDGQMVQLFF